MNLDQMVRRHLVSHHLHEAARNADKAAACADHMLAYYSAESMKHLRKACDELGLSLIGTLELREATKIVETANV